MSEEGEGDQKIHRQCEVCRCDVGRGVSFYEGVYYTGKEEPDRRFFCSIPCLSQFAYSQAERVDLPGGSGSDIGVHPVEGDSDD